MVEWGKTGPGPATGNLPLQKVPKKQINECFYLELGMKTMTNHIPLKGSQETSKKSGESLVSF